MIYCVRLDWCSRILNLLDESETATELHPPLSQQTANGLYIAIALCGVQLRISVFHPGLNTVKVHAKSFSEPSTGRAPPSAECLLHPSALSFLLLYCF